MRNLWESWLSALSSTDSTYRQGVQQWQQSVSGFWSMPASYWQTVFSIYDSRARTMAQLWEGLPEAMAQCAKAQSSSEGLEAAQKLWGYWWSEGLKHAATAQTHRMHLLQEWKRQTERMLPPALRFDSSTSLMNGWMKLMQDWQPTAYTVQKSLKDNPWMPDMSKVLPSTTGTMLNPFQAVTSPSSYMEAPVNMVRDWFQMCQSTMDATQCNWQNFTKSNGLNDMAASVKPVAPVEAPKAEAAPAPKPAPRMTDVKAPVSKDEPKAKPEPEPAASLLVAKAEAEKKAQPATVAAPAPQARAVAEPAKASPSQMTLLTPPSAPEAPVPGLNGAPHHSSTASNGVVRASGAVVSAAAAAAARRSVVARRASRSRPRIVRPVR